MFRDFVESANTFMAKDKLSSFILRAINVGEENWYRLNRKDLACNELGSCMYDCLSWRCGGLVVSALVSGSNSPGSNLGRGHCVVFLGKTLYSHSASLHPGV